MTTKTINLKEYIDSECYTKSQTWTQTEISEQIVNAISGIELVEVVAELPTTNIKNNRLYLLLNSVSLDENKYDIYLRVNNKWERIDSLEFNISDYLTESEINTLLAGKADLNHTHSEATTSSNGFLSSTDKTKLDSVETGANNITVDTSLSSSSTNPLENKAINTALSSKAPTSHASSGTTYGVSSASNYGHSKASNTTPKANGTASVGSETSSFARGDHVHPTDTTRASTDVATTSSNGLMSANDKTKLEGVDVGANKTTVDNSLSNTSTNPVQNKVIYSALEDKADSDDLASVATSGSYNDLSDKPSSITPSSHTHGNISNDGKVGTAANKPLITGANGAVNTGSFGTSANTFCEGNDSRLSNARTPTSHTHGNITNTGAIGSTSGLPIITTTNGVLTTGSFGSGAGKFVEGNDSRLSDARTPTAHNQASSTITDTNTYNNIGNTANTQEAINTAIDNKLGSISNIELVTVVSSLPSASASTMNKLYLVAESTSKTQDNYEIFITVKSGSNYSWEKVDTARIDLSGYVTTNDTRLTDARTPLSHTHGSVTNDGKIGTASGKIITTGTGGALQASDSITKSMISDFPSSMTPTSHTHGSISNTGTLNSDTNNVNKIVVTDNSNNIKTASGLDYDFINFVDSYTGMVLLESDNGGILSAIGISYDTTADEILFPTTNLYDSDGIQLAKLSDIPSTSNFITKSSSNNLLLANGNNIPQSTFLTEHQDISGKADSSDLGAVAFSNSYDDLDDLPTIPDMSNFITTAGTGLSKSSNTLNHSNSVTAATSSVFKKISYDATGHITGTADVAASDLPSHTHTSSQITDQIGTYYGTCSTSASTRAKVVSCTNFVLSKGNVVYVKFTNAQTYNGTVTLNVNSKGAVTVTNSAKGCWNAGETVGFMYDGSTFYQLGRYTNGVLTIY